MFSEFCTEAIVLGRNNLGEMDSRVFLYTKDFGKIAAKAKSARKITSKLSAHLEPLNLINARLISGKDYQIVDALRFGRLTDPGFMKIFNLVNNISMENQPDEELWRVLKAQFYDPSPMGELARAILKISGFDPQFAACQHCQSANPSHFLMSDGQYLCQSCLMNYNYMNNDAFAI